jgi:hypothetical protein
VYEEVKRGGMLSLLTQFIYCCDDSGFGLKLAGLRAGQLNFLSIRHNNSAVQYCSQVTNRSVLFLFILSLVEIRHS